MATRDRHQKRRRKKAIAAAVEGGRPAPDDAPGRPVEMFYAGWQAVKVRALQIMLILAGPWIAWWGWDMAFNPTEILDSSGDVVPWAVRYGTAAFLFLIGAGGAVGMVVFGWCYVTRAVWDPQTERCRLTLAGLLVPVHLDVPAADEPRWRHDHGFSRADRITVHAPSHSIRVPGRRLRLILDMQGVILCPRLLDDVLLGGGSELRFLDDMRPFVRHPWYLSWRD